MNFIISALLSIAERAETLSIWAYYKPKLDKK